MVNIAETVDPKSQQLNADDLLAGPRTVKITDVRGAESDDQPVLIFFEGDKGRPYKPCLSMRRVLLKVWGEDGSTYAGKSMTLYNDPEVQFGGIKVGGIRISHMSHIDRRQELMLTTTRSKRKAYIVEPLPESDTEAVILRANAAADKGTEAFKEYWNTEDAKTHRADLKPHLEAFKRRAMAADEAAKPLSQRIAEEPGEKPDAAPEAPESPTDPVQEGRDAYTAGKSMNENPYTGDNAARWEDGWTQAEEAEAS